LGAASLDSAEPSVASDFGAGLAFAALFGFLAFDFSLAFEFTVFLAVSSVDLSLDTSFSAVSVSGISFVFDSALLSAASTLAAGFDSDALSDVVDLWSNGVSDAVSSEAAEAEGSSRR